MSGAYTAGPWQTRGDFSPEDRLTIIANIDGEYIDGVPHCTYETVAICQDEFSESLPNATANARLIASAPELLEALKAIMDAETVSVHVGYDNGAGGGNYVYADAVRTDDEAFCKAKAALLKATGGDQ